tara:strand:- start:221 stop:475 length:255 start_codon:yes stop_codon:yes gene_type:complete
MAININGPGVPGPRGPQGSTGSISESDGATFGGTAFVNNVIPNTTREFSVGATTNAFKDIYVSGTIHFMDPSGNVVASITSGSA